MIDRQWGVPTSLGSRIPLSSLIQTLAVAEYLSFRHAGNMLGIAQSSISRRIKLLEEELGILLFERSTRGVRLTEAGRRFVEGVAAGIDQLDHAVKTAGAFACGDLGRIRIGVHALAPGSFLDGLLAGYREAHPQVIIEIAEGTAHDSIHQLRTRELDIAFVAGAPDLPDCHTRRIWHEPLFAALPANHALVDRSGVTWADLAGETFLVRNGGTGPQAYEYIIQRLAGRWPAGPSILRCDVERNTLMQMIAQGFGVSIAGRATALINMAGVAFRPFYDEPEPVPFSAVWSPYNQSATLRNLLHLAGRLGRSRQGRAIL
ncbi:LysR family transcriptional regulator [Nitratireductor sp. StC3]|uniref:LysR family transcriptional regulator n=1 Tax=Nitratireductor sp. StC3 TaxID=2126741 RepID=UPI000D0E0B24|nr:LysR family transcriptional regulator [Nitratireductor sp. StC3]PSM17370.1 LysR family transcriptional regulator [Nitratireductor sp. StC3]